MTFIDAFKTAQQRFLRPAIFILVAAAAIYPLVPSVTYKYVALYVLANALIRMIFDIEATLAKRLSSIDGRIGEMQATLKGPNPPTWDNYTSAQHLILKDITDAFERGDDVTLEIIGVSARYSWRMVEDNFGPLLKQHDQRKLTVHVAVCTEDTLEKWNLTSWSQDLRRTISGMEDFSRIHHEAIDNGRLVLKRYDCDNLPQWHGVLINQSVLYMGRTEWIFHADSPAALKVGTCPYRRFEPADLYGGHPRIRMFSNWMERMRRRSDELQGRGKVSE